MRDNRDVLYRVPKDLAYRYLKRYISNDSVKLIVYKSCVDHYIMKKTFWNSMQLLSQDGFFAVQCCFENISRVVELIGEEGYGYDIVIFHGKNIEGVILFVFVYKDKKYCKSHVPDVIQYDQESPLQEISFRILNATQYSDLIVYIGDAMVMAPVAKAIGREIVVFGDDPILESVIVDEGVLAKEVKL